MMLVLDHRVDLSRWRAAGFLYNIIGGSLCRVIIAGSFFKWQRVCLVNSNIFLFGWSQRLALIGSCARLWDLSA